MDQHRPLTERKHLFYLLQRYTKLKVELKREIKIAKELLLPSPNVEDLIRRQENLLERVEKRVWEFQMQLEVARTKGRC